MAAVAKTIPFLLLVSVRPKLSNVTKPIALRNSVQITALSLLLLPLLQSEIPGQICLEASTRGSVALCSGHVEPGKSNKVHEVIYALGSMKVYG